jgi:hypothetical protein
VIKSEDREGFARHAAPEAIAHQLKLAEAASRKAERDRRWLADLLRRRTAEQDAGTWPANTVVGDAEVVGAS